MARFSDATQTLEPARRAIAEPLVTELNFMKVQLTKLRKQVREDGCTEVFVQGKQSMERMTPSFQAYTKLVSKYSTLLRQLNALIPEDAGQGDELDAFLQELG